MFCFVFFFDCHFFFGVGGVTFASTCTLIATGLARLRVLKTKLVFIIFVFFSHFEVLSAFLVAFLALGKDFRFCRF